MVQWLTLYTDTIFCNKDPTLFPIGRPVFFNLFAAAEPYVHCKCEDHSRNPWDLRVVREVEGKVTVSECLGTDVKRQWKCEGLDKSLQKLTIKQQAKRLA